MSSKDNLVETAARSVGCAGADSQKEIMGVLQAFKDKLLPNMRNDDAPGVIAPTYILRGNTQLGAGVVMALKDRVIVGWMKGLLKKPVVAELPLASIERIEAASKPAGGRFTKPLASLRLVGRDDWELLFAADTGGLALRDGLAQVLAGPSDSEPLADGAPDAS